jgi:uncharacterized protein (DUF1697 family)
MTPCERLQPRGAVRRARLGSRHGLNLLLPMKTYIALFRGINVGGSHMLPMKDLKLMLEQNACVDVRTYIQSGNVIFRSTMSDVERLAKRLTAAVSKSHGFEPRVLVLTRAELESAAAGNPFPEASENPKSLHLFFLSEAPQKPDLKACETLKAKTERFELKGPIFYLHTPEGFGTSKLAGRAERLLGVAATARNWRTVTTLLEMAKGSA